MGMIKKEKRITLGNMVVLIVILFLWNTVNGVDLLRTYWYTIRMEIINIMK